MSARDEQAMRQLDAQAQAYQDHLVGARLPGWLRATQTARLDDLEQALGKSLEYRQRVHDLLSKVEDIQAFTRRALESALQQRFNVPFDTARWTLRVGRHEVVINQQPVGVHLTEVVYEQVPLLEAALRNFTAQEAADEGQPRGNRLTSQQPGEASPLSAVEFAALCRTLDLGGCYQRHLQAVFEPPDDDRAQEAPLSQLANAQRYAMLVDAYRAGAEGRLTDEELQVVVALCQNHERPRLGGAPVVAKQLQVLGCYLSQIVVLDIIDEGLVFNSSKRVLVYIPGDPFGPWSAFPSLQRFARSVLGQRLRRPAYQQFFSRFVRRRDSQRFFSTIITGYRDLPVWANIDLYEYTRAFSGPLFDSLAALSIRQIKDDAALIAAPVAALDRQAQREHDQRLAAQGWTLLTLAGLYVPAIGSTLLAWTVWELLGEVFQGFEDWREGDTRDALGHLMNVARDLAIMGSFAAGGVAVQRAWRRSAKVDGLVPARLEGGTLKLWNQDLTRYRCKAPPVMAIPDRAGIFHLSGMAWVRMAGHYYRVRQRAADRRWQLLPGTLQGDDAALHENDHAPLLRSNGAGAWRLGSEQPLEWEGPHYLFRRLGGQLAELDDEQIDQVLVIHGLDEDQLRALHVHDQAPDAALLDTVERTLLDQRIRDLVGSLRSGRGGEDPVTLLQAKRLPGAATLSDQQLAERVWCDRRLLLQRLYDLQQREDGPSGVLRRAFPSLHPRAARALLDAAGSADLQRLHESGRIGLQLAEAGAALALHVRVVRVYEAFFLDTPQTRDLARVAIGMLRYLPGAAEGVRWRLFEAHAQGPQLLTLDQGRQAWDLVHVDGRFMLHDAQGIALGDPGELFEMMARAYADDQRQAMGIGEPFAHNLRVLLGRQALRNRAEVERSLHDDQGGRYRLPWRQPDGRVGYPLSGHGAVRRQWRRGQAQALLARVRELYPGFSEQNVTQWIDTVRQSGRSVHRELDRLAEELDELEDCLFQWAEQPASSVVRQARDTVRVAFNNCWRRVRIVGPYPDPLSNHFRLTIQGMRIGQLPELPAQVSFGHVVELLLMDMDMEQIPASFWRAFPRLQVLDLGGNRLTRVPQQLMRLEHLHELILVDNQIVLDGPQAVTLSRCVHLVLLDLSHNPLGRTFSLARLDQLLRLDMRNTGITQLPEALLDLPQLVYADLRDNRINALPAAYDLAPMDVRRRLRLAGNPCDQRRLAGQLDDWPHADDPDEHPISPRQRWSQAIGSQGRGGLLACWSVVESEEGAERVFRVLRQLLRSEGFRRNPQAMAYRVLGVLRAMADDPVLRRQLFDVANDEWGCQDGASWCFDNLEVSMLVYRAQTDAQGHPEQALLHLGRRLWRLEEVDRIALLDARARGLEAESSEVGLAFRIGLRERLDLPIGSDDMSYAQVAGVDGPMLDRAYQRVLASETPGRLAESLVDRPFWQACLERIHTDRLMALDAPFQQRLAAVLDDEASLLGEQLERASVIRDEQRAARRALMLELTLAALETPSPGPSGTAP